MYTKSYTAFTPPIYATRMEGGYTSVCEFWLNTCYTLSELENTSIKLVFAVIIILSVSLILENCSRRNVMKCIFKFKCGIEWTLVS